MTIRTRIFLVYLVLVGGGLYYLMTWILDGVRPRYLESMEESLVDAANLLATVVETKAVTDGKIDARVVQTALERAYRRELDAPVYSIHKTNIDLRIYVTDGTGRVLYDSDHGRAVGQDYSKWNDVRRTLAGSYGARATRIDPHQESSLVIHVAAPIYGEARDGRLPPIIGVITLGKPTQNVNQLVEVAKRRIVWAGLGGGALIVLTGFTFSVWLTTPIERLTTYARAVRDGKPASLPRLAGREVSDLRRAFEEMRDALEGKKYVERYTQALTHEIKAPLSAIRGAAELLAENMPPEDRTKFIKNIRHESARIQQIVDQLLQLSALEARRELGLTEQIDARSLVEETLRGFQPALQARQVTTELLIEESLCFRGEKFLVTLAVTNLLKNAIEFSPSGGVIRIEGRRDKNRGHLVVEDQGPGIPDYARERIFERFYSLPRPDTGAKSTGLGLSFVQEIAHLHGGAVQVNNRPVGGCRAELILPA